MRTVVLGPPPPELAALIERRHQLGLDKYDEVWGGEYHMAPMAHSSHGELQMQVGRILGPWADNAGLILTGPFNLGGPDDFRVPDLGLHWKHPNAVWVSTAAIVVEIESPDDETWEKLTFYAAKGVDEVLIVSGERHAVTWLVREGDDFVSSPASNILGALSESLEDRIDWPSTGSTPT